MRDFFAILITLILVALIIGVTLIILQTGERGWSIAYIPLIVFSAYWLDTINDTYFKKD